MTGEGTVAQPLLLGVRHHGPGSARAVRRALSAFRPQIVLVEGPPEADAVVALAGDERMRAPVAILACPVGQRVQRGSAAFWPFAEFSPEWQAIRWALANDVAVRFIDLPAAVRLAMDAGMLPETEAASEAGGTDPVAALAAAAGYDDPERWWEDVVEHRRSPPAERGSEEAAFVPFAVIAEAMEAVRASGATQRDQERREASMRRAIRAAAREYEKIAVVCGAWHVPALTAPMPSASADTAILRGLPRIKVTVSWVPWTHVRMASGSGYGAGVSSPGWYHHLFTAPDQPVARWLVRAAGVLRREGIDVSSDHVIEATRLAEALATVRGRPLAGLTEVTDAAGAVLCGGDELRLALINRRLVVGERFGRVPETETGLPLLRDVSAAQRRLRLPPNPLPREIDLDLRREIDLERSRLLRRLLLLGVEWGRSIPTRRGRGTFRESWRLGWRPEFSVDLIAASAYGASLIDAATARVSELAHQAATLKDVTGLVEQCLLADLGETLPGLVTALGERVALDCDVAHLMEALPALTRTLRYGDVRGTDLDALQGVAAGMVTRVCVGLPGALHGLDEPAAAAMRDRIDAVHASIGLLRAGTGNERPGAAEMAEMWHEALASLATEDWLPALLSGRLNRLLLDAGIVEVRETAGRMALTLTVGVPPQRAAAWIEGFLSGDGLLLVHDERLLHLVDEWLTGIPPAAFIEVLPLLRRTFSGYSGPERRMIGERAAGLRAGGDSAERSDDQFDAERGAAVLRTVAGILGWDERVTGQVARQLGGGASREVSNG
ncbi:MAG: hypothetical protein JXA67_09650 [Micromonosporaceae bacterium]|nr:hypothetical protein [Micromonosporaceae bacterium]